MTPRLSPGNLPRVTRSTVNYISDSDLCVLQQGCFPRLGFPPPSNQAKGWRRLSRWTWRFARLFQPTSLAASFEMGGSEGASSRPRLMSRGSPDIKRADCRKITSALQARTRFEPISSRTGASPSFLPRLQMPACFEPILRFPFFEGERPFVGAHGRAAIERW
jgi:hypothetical protein